VIADAVTLNYRHAYHAGNFADCFKHVALRLLLAAMHRKAKPFCYLDTHAGGAGYPLDSEAAARTQEWRNGIGRLWHSEGLEASVAAHVAAVRAEPGNDVAVEPRVVPGSARIGQSWLRDGDRAVVCDALPEAATELKAAFRDDDRIAVHQRDGYEALKACLPPHERRGVVLVDPPFEQADEFQRLLKAVRTAHRRWATGVYALWYPIKDEPAVAAFRQGLIDAGIPRVLIAEFWPRPRDVAGRFAGCGLAILNPPWQLDDQLRSAAGCLVDRLADNRDLAGYRVEWLVGE
jgi:23S rRNA (adenine2030-N6)-methyltransferase